jgi:L-amino acid N-acyltransferase YncA
MVPGQLRVRPAVASDLVAVAAIYAHEVHTSTATFDLREPPLSWWQAKLDTAAG